MSTGYPRMIEADGSLGVRIPSQAMTWFSFLQASRLVNANRGGWNSKSYWFSRGIDCLTNQGQPAGFLEIWTKSSLKENAVPLARTSDFKFNERLNALSKGERGIAGTPTGENKLNWNLSRWIKISRSGKRSFATYELPLAAEKDGQLKADVAVFDQSGFIEIIELKKSGLGASPDNPLMALVEAICYSLQLLRCWAHVRAGLKDVSPGEWPNLQDIKTISIVLAGPESEYWNICKPCKKRSLKSTIDKVDAQALHVIVRAVEASLRSHHKLPNLNLTLTLADVISNGEQGLKALNIEGIENEPPVGSIVCSRLG